MAKSGTAGDPLPLCRQSHKVKTLPSHHTSCVSSLISMLHPGCLGWWVGSAYPKMEGRCHLICWTIITENCVRMNIWTSSEPATASLHSLKDTSMNVIKIKIWTHLNTKYCFQRGGVGWKGVGWGCDAQDTFVVYRSNCWWLQPAFLPLTVCFTITDHMTATSCALHVHITQCYSFLVKSRYPVQANQ